MNFNERQIPPPKYWQQFEDLCLSLFRNIWRDPTAQKNGRSGQTQHGTDVWGGADYDGGAFHGVQCKGKNIGLGAAVTENELRSEVEKAKQFTPQLSHWILATTAPKDAAIEAVAREITKSHKANGLFAVQVFGWEDLQSLIAKYSDVIQEFYPEQAPANAAVPDSIEMIAAAKKAASDALQEFGFRLKEQPIAPLLTAAPGEMAGTNLIATLSAGDDVLLLGRSGLGKSFHLQHYSRRCLELDEIPILLHAGHYGGDLNGAIHRTIGPYTSLTPVELLDATRRVGKRLALIVDDWNKCTAALQGDLSNDLASFQLRYGVRIAIASQQRPPQPFFTKFKGVELAALRVEQKNQIFSFHAAAQETGSSCAFSEAFSTAFDLSIAGRSCKGGSFPVTRWELYDNYARLRLPSATARATARQLAWFMGENFRPFLLTAEFERISERIANDLGAPITVVDDVLRSGLMLAEADTVAFEHDLLKDFFRAEFLLRDAAGQMLVERLLEPKYADLAEFVAPNIAEEDILRRFLDSANSALLSMGYRGNLGHRAQTAIRQRCRDLLVKTRDNLPKVEVEAVAGEFPDGRKFVSAAYTDVETSASTHEVAICSVIANNLDNRILREAFLELLDLGEKALRAAADNAARIQRLKPLPVWRELIRLNVVLRHSRPIHPLLLMCVEIRDKTPLGKSLLPSPLHDALFEKTALNENPTKGPFYAAFFTL